MNTKLLGRWGEAKAAEYLKSKGYSIEGMNYSVRFGEVDIIAQKGSETVFVEVKLRKNDSFAPARDNVTFSKQQKLRAAASMWLDGRNDGRTARFDVIEIYAPEGTATVEPVINHIENAF